MWNIKCILHPTDFSQAAANAFQLARAVAKDYGAKLFVLHAIEPSLIDADPMAAMPPVDREAIEAELQAIQAAHPDLSIEYRLVEGEAVEAILETARKLGCDLIVMGTHRRTQIPRLLKGGVAENVARNATRPVLTVTIPAPEKDLARGESILGHAMA
jgi:nucleotide-binding universal stress UspA family protein